MLLIDIGDRLNLPRYAILWFLFWVSMLAHLCIGRGVSVPVCRAADEGSTKIAILSQ